MWFHTSPSEPKAAVSILPGRRRLLYLFEGKILSRKFIAGGGESVIFPWKWSGFSCLQRCLSLTYGIQAAGKLPVTLFNLPCASLPFILENNRNQMFQCAFLSLKYSSVSFTAAVKEASYRCLSRFLFPWFDRRLLFVWQPLVR